MNRDLAGELRPDGTATLTGIALVARPPFVGAGFDAIVSGLKERAASGRLYVVFEGGRLPQEPWRTRLRDVCATVSSVEATDDGVRVVAQLHQTLRGSEIYRLLRPLADADPPLRSGIAFTTFAMGRIVDGVAADVVPAGIFIVRSDLLEG